MIVSRCRWVSLPGLSFGLIVGLSQPTLAQAIQPDIGTTGTGTAVNQSGNQFDITGGTLSGDDANLFHSFDQFGLATGQRANFVTAPTVSNVLSSVVGGASYIDGLLQVSGSDANLYLINPAGIVFGQNASLNLGGSFTATTATGLGFSNNWFNALDSNDYAQLVGSPNSFIFAGETAGTLVNQGDLAVNGGEQITLLGGSVINTGTLMSPGGEITVVAVPGESQVTLSQENSLLSLTLETLPTTTDDLIPADFSPVNLPTLLTGAATTIGEPSLVVNEDGNISLINTNTVVPILPELTMVSGTVDVAGVTGSDVGGDITLLGDQVALVDAEIVASGDLGGGNIRIGGGYKGLDTVPNATQTYVSEDSIINADALINGNGGLVILWANGQTSFYGEISGQGGVTAGDGGFVEVSGKDTLIYRGNVNLLSSHGNAGTLLLDPLNIYIVEGDGSTHDFDPDDDGLDDDELKLNDNEILLADGPGETFTISENKLESLSGSSDIVLEAENDIVIKGLADDVLSFKEGSGSIKFKADADNDGQGSFLVGDSDEDTLELDAPDDFLISTQESDLTIEAANIVTGNIETDGGNVDLTATDGNVIVGYIDASGDGGNITIDAAGIFRATSSTTTGENLENSPLSLVSEANGADGGTIKIVHGGDPVFIVAVKVARRARDNSAELDSEGNIIFLDASSLEKITDVQDIIFVGDLDFDGFTGNQSGSVGAVISYNSNGDAQAIYLDENLIQNPEPTPENVPAPIPQQIVIKESEEAKQARLERERLERERQERERRERERLERERQERERQERERQEQEAEADSDSESDIANSNADESENNTTCPIFFSTTLLDVTAFAPEECQVDFSSSEP